MTIGAVFPEISQPGGPAGYIRRFVKNAPGRRVVVAAGMSPLMQSRLEARDDAVIRHRDGNLEIAYSPMLWPFRQEGGIASDQLRYPTIPAEQYERLFARIFERSGHAVPEVFLQQGLEYASGNVAEGLARFDNGRRNKVVMPFVNCPINVDLSNFDLFDHALYLSPHQQRLWNDRRRGVGSTQRLRSTVIPPLLDPYLLSPGRQPLFVHAQRPRSKARVFLIPVHFWTEEEGARVISAIRWVLREGQSVVAIAPDPRNLTTSAQSNQVWQHIARSAQHANITLIPRTMTTSSMIDLARRVDAVVIPRSAPSLKVVGSIASLELMYAGVSAVHLAGDRLSLPQAIDDLAGQLGGRNNSMKRSKELDLLADLSITSASTDLHFLMRELSKPNVRRYSRVSIARQFARSDEMPERWAVRATRTISHLRNAVPEVTLLGNAAGQRSVADATRAKPQALFLMDTGNLQSVFSAVYAATDLERPLYILCSNDDELARLRMGFPFETRLGKNVHVLNIQWFNGIDALNLPVDGHPLASAHIRDLARKRNAALLLAAKLGFDVIAMLDNDVHRNVTPLSDVIVGAAEYLREHQELQSVGVPYGTDNGTYDHAYWFYTTIGRTDLAERHTIDARSFHGGGFHLLRVKGSDPFPALYDDDWFQIARIIREKSIALLSVNAGQLSPSALHAHHRAALEEEGDCIAETILQSIVDGGAIDEVLRLYSESPKTPHARERARALLVKELSSSVAERYAARLDLASLLPPTPKSKSKKRPTLSSAQMARRAILQAAVKLTAELPTLGAEWFLSYLDSAERWRAVIDATEPLRMNDVRSAIRELGGNVTEDVEPKGPAKRLQQWAKAVRSILMATGDPHGFHADGPLLADRYFDMQLSVSKREKISGVLLRVWSRLPGSAPQLPGDWSRLAAVFEAFERHAGSQQVFFALASGVTTPSEIAGRLRLNLPDGPVHMQMAPWYDQLSRSLDEISRLPLDDAARLRLQSLREYVAVGTVDYSVRQAIIDRVDGEVERLTENSCVSSFESHIEAMINVLYEMPALHPDSALSPSAGVPILALLAVVENLRSASLRTAENILGRSSGQLSEGFEKKWLAETLAPNGSTSPLPQDHLDHILQEIVVNGYQGFLRLVEEKREQSRSSSLSWSDSM